MDTKKTKVPALSKALLIMDLLIEKGGELHAAEIASILHLPKSTVHGLLHTLTAHNVLKKNNDQRYQLGPHVIQWAHGFLAGQDIVTAFQEEVVKLRGFDNYTLTMSVREKKEVVYLACKNSEAPLGFNFRLGMKLPAAFTSTGKAMLSDLSDDEIVALYADGWPAKMTKNSVDSLEALMEEILAVRRQGYSIDNGQIMEGMYCIGKSIKNETGTSVAAIAISLAKEDFCTTKALELAHWLEELVHRLEASMGFKKLNTLNLSR